jgi:hypothetical protein
VIVSPLEGARFFLSSLPRAYEFVTKALAPASPACILFHFLPTACAVGYVLTRVSRAFCLAVPLSTCGPEFRDRLLRPGLTSMCHYVACIFIAANDVGLPRARGPNHLLSTSGIRK